MVIRGVKIGATLSPGGDGGTLLTYPYRIKNIDFESSELFLFCVVLRYYVMKLYVSEVESIIFECESLMVM